MKQTEPELEEKLFLITTSASEPKYSLDHYLKSLNHGKLQVHLGGCTKPGWPQVIFILILFHK